jgi:hypothetical protein
MMERVIGRKYQVCLIGLLMAGAGPGWLSERAWAQGGGVNPIHELHGEAAQTAEDARGQADRLCLAFQDKYRWGAPTKKNPNPPPNPGSPEAKEEYQAVIDAYKRVIEGYPQTELAAYCQMRLAGFYQYGRQGELMMKMAEEVARTYPGTKYETRAYMMAGLYELQHKNQPRAAIEWFKKVKRPAEGAPPKDELAAQAGMLQEDEMAYVNAQQHIAKSEFKLGEFAMGQARTDRLCERYPKYASEWKKRYVLDQKDAISKTAAPVPSEAELAEAKGKLELEEKAVTPEGGKGDGKAVMPEGGK